MKTEKRYYLTADRSRVVEHGDPEAAFLFAAKGSEIADHIAKKMGIHPDHPDQAVQLEQAKAVKAPAEDKAIRSPRQTK